MFGIGFGELLVLAVVLLIAVGPEKMPTFVKAVGKGIREFRRATRELKNSVGLDELLRDEELRELRDLRRPLATGPRPVPSKPTPSDPPKAKEEAQEYPEEGVDVAHAAKESLPPPVPDGRPVAREDSVSTTQQLSVEDLEPVSVDDEKDGQPG
jgi:Tat protein translocase TatB subunit